MRGTHTSFASLKQINAGVLNVGYAEAGPANGPAFIILHGWPYDIHTYVDVAPLLAARGYRAIVPYFRGYGSTRFLSTQHDTKRSAVGDRPRRHRVMDALRIDKAILGGSTGRSDRGNVAALWPEAARLWCQSAAT